MPAAAAVNVNKKPRLLSSAATEDDTKNNNSSVVFNYKIWPSSLDRAGHTTVKVEDPNEPLYQFFKDQVTPNERYYGIHMGRMQKNVPCLLMKTSKFRHGAERWWCPVHQGQYGLKSQLEEENTTGVRRCECANDPVDFVRVQDIPVFCLSTKPNMEDNTTYCELGIWIGLPPAINTKDPDAKFFPGIHVHARKEPGGKKVVDTNFPAVTIRDTTGRFLQLQGEGVTITSPAALEFLYYMENQCPVNRSLKLSSSEEEDDDKEKIAVVPRKFGLELVANVKCKSCGALHEDVGDFFGANLHKKHLCGQCGRAIMGAANIGNPLMAFRRKYKREIVGGDKSRLDISSKDYHIMMWPSTPAIFWSRNSSEVWGIHVHGYDKDSGECKIDDTYGEVWLDGKKLDRSNLFRDMIKATQWVSDPKADPSGAEELEDD